jgi:hypothetical protein
MKKIKILNFLSTYSILNEATIKICLLFGAAQSISLLSQNVSLKLVVIASYSMCLVVRPQRWRYLLHISKGTMSSLPSFILPTVRSSCVVRAYADTLSITRGCGARVDDPDNLPESFEIQWDSLGELARYVDTPEKVVQSWINRFDFRTEDEEQDLPGLRSPQIGALHAIAAHFAVGSTFEPATVVLPTGTGKTETMLATLVYQRLRRTLVLVPNDTLRSQIAEKFLSLGVLRETQVIAGDLANPRVAIITTGIRSTDELNLIVQNANVIVALRMSLTLRTTKLSVVLQTRAPISLLTRHTILQPELGSASGAFRRKASSPVYRNPLSARRQTCRWQDHLQLQAW